MFIFIVAGGARHEGYGEHCTTGGAYVQRRRRFAPVRLWFDSPATAAHGSLPNAPHSGPWSKRELAQNAECRSVRADGAKR